MDEDEQLSAAAALIRMRDGLRVSGMDQEGNARAVSEFLRSDAPLEPFQRYALADLIDPDGSSNGRLIWSMRRRGKGQVAMAEVIDRFHAELRAYEIVSGREEGTKQESAVQQAIELTGLTRSQVFASLKRYREAEKRWAEEAARKGGTEQDTNSPPR